MPKVQFLASVADDRPGQEGIVYGKGHVTDFQEEDIEFVKAMHAQGKLYLIAEETPPAPPFDAL